MKINIKLNRYIANLAIISMFFCNAIFAEKIYKWKDENGVVHYSQKPHGKTQTNEDTLEAEKTPEEAKIKYKEILDEQEKETKEFYENKKREDMSEEEIANREKLVEYCKTARDNISVLNDKSNRKFKDSEGNYSYYTDEIRAEKIKKAQDFIDKHCKDI